MASVFACILRSRICSARSGVGFARPAVASVFARFVFVFARFCLIRWCLYLPVLARFFSIRSCSYLPVLARFFSIRLCSYLPDLPVCPQTSSALSACTLLRGDVKKRAPNAGPRAYRLLRPPTATSHARVRSSVSFFCLFRPARSGVGFFFACILRSHICSARCGVGFARPAVASVFARPAVASVLLDPQWRRFLHASFSCLLDSARFAGVRIRPYLLDSSRFARARICPICPFVRLLRPPTATSHARVRSSVSFFCQFRPARSGVGFVPPAVASVLLLFFVPVFARDAPARPPSLSRCGIGGGGGGFFARSTGCRKEKCCYQLRGSKKHGISRRWGGGFLREVRRH